MQVKLFFHLDPFSPKGSGTTGTPLQKERTGATGKLPKRKAALSEKGDEKKGMDLATYS